MRTQDLHELSKIRDRLSYLYVEHCRVEQDNRSIAIHDKAGTTPVPTASLALLMLGPGVSITHAAVLALADNGCLLVWCGEQGVRFYASGTGVTRSAARLIHQSLLVSRKTTRLAVVCRMYNARFPEPLEPTLTLQQIRGMEGVRVRDTYARWSQETGVPWNGRSYKRDSWAGADPINRALSTANACLYGICHAAIVAAGYSPALGFVHCGKQLSFVYDVADLYKAETSIPAAFITVASNPAKLETATRHACRDMFAKERLLLRIVNDIERILDIEAQVTDDDEDFDSDAALPSGLWDPDGVEVSGGQNYAESPDETKES